MTLPDKRDRRASVATLLAGFLVMGSPVLLFGSRLTDVEALALLYGVLAIVALAGGLTCFIVAAYWSWKSRRAAWIPFFFLATVGISMGGFILALAPDETVFIATLVSAMFALVVSWYERVYRRLERRRRVPRVPK